MTSVLTLKIFYCCLFLLLRKWQHQNMEDAIEKLKSFKRCVIKLYCKEFKFLFVKNVSCVALFLLVWLSSLIYAIISNKVKLFTDLSSCYIFNISLMSSISRDMRKFFLHWNMNQGLQRYLKKFTRNLRFK